MRIPTSPSYQRPKLRSWEVKVYSPPGFAPLLSRREWAAVRDAQRLWRAGAAAGVTGTVSERMRERVRRFIREGGR